MANPSLDDCLKQKGYTFDQVSGAPDIPKLCAELAENDTLRAAAYVTEFKRKLAAQADFKSSCLFL